MKQAIITSHKYPDFASVVVEAKKPIHEILNENNLTFEDLNDMIYGEIEFNIEGVEVIYNADYDYFYQGVNTLIEIFDDTRRIYKSTIDALYVTTQDLYVSTREVTNQLDKAFRKVQ